MPRRNPMPDPEPIWLALGMVIWAVARALGPRRRDAFIDALAAIATDQDASRRIISIRATNGGRRALTQSVMVAARFITRIVAELRAADR